MKSLYVRLAILLVMIIGLFVVNSSPTSNNPEPIAETPGLTTVPQTAPEQTENTPITQEVATNNTKPVETTPTGPVSTPINDNTSASITQNNAQPSQTTPVSEPTATENKPKITGITPETVEDGGEVVILGENLTKNMTLIVRYGIAEQRLVINSQDGKTAHFTFRSPLPSTPNMNISPEAQQQLAASLENADQTLETFLTSTSRGDIVDQYSVILVINGESIVSPQKLHHVR